MTTATRSTEAERLQALIAKLIARDRWTPEQVSRHQRARLRQMIGHAISDSSYYREALGPEGAERPLEELPILTKTMLMEHFDGIVTDPRVRRAEVEAHLAGPEPGADFAGEYALITTSGTTGARGVFVYSREEMRLWLAAMLRTMTRLGARPGMRMIGIGSPSPLFMSRRVFTGVESTASERPPDLSVTMPIEELVNGLNAFQPEAMLGYPSITALLAEEQLAGRLEISPAMVGCGSEVMTGEHARSIEEAWRISPGNAYVATEACPIASGGRPQDGGLHICEDLVVVEVVDESGSPVPPGTPGHRVLLTNLVNRTQPLIRYELTDSVTLAEGPNPAGMPWRQIERVDGRSAEILWLPGLEGDVALHPHRLRAPFTGLTDVLQYQFQFDGERLLILVVPRPGAAGDLDNRVREATAAVLKEAGVTRVFAEAKVVDSIPREPGGAAKLKQLKLTGRAATPGG
jgi:phenylacetate-coenzyme A ligase PaaK-like adenylate-forming protein